MPDSIKNLSVSNLNLRGLVFTFTGSFFLLQIYLTYSTNEAADDTLGTITQMAKTFVTDVKKLLGILLCLVGIFYFGLFSTPVVRNSETAPFLVFPTKITTLKTKCLTPTIYNSPYSPKLGIKIKKKEGASIPAISITPLCSPYSPLKKSNANEVEGLNLITKNFSRNQEEGTDIDRNLFT